MPHVATPRKSDFPIPNTRASWTLRSAGGSRPTLVVWGTPPAESILDRLARSGLAVLTPPEHATPADLASALASLPGSVRVALTRSPTADESKALDELPTLWRCVKSEWDELPGWFAERPR